MRRRHLVCLVVALGIAPVRAGAGVDGVSAAGAGPGSGLEGGSGHGPAPDAAALVAAMSESMRRLDYEGTFVHVAGGHLSSMHILHSSDERGELERMRALDGEAREVVRDHELVTCIWPASGSVVVTRAEPREALPDVDASLATHPNYRISRLGEGRVAGLDTHVVAIEPRDRYRYGYRFWIDAGTHMLLRSMLLDGAGRVLEEVMFTSIEYLDDVDPARFAIATRPGGERGSRWAAAPAHSPVVGAGGPAGAPVDASPDAEPADRVDFAALPPGYEELGETYLAMPAAGGPVSHVMLSDGVASVSVYVEHADRAAQDTSAAGPSRIGGINAWGASLEDGFVTVVGEVPAATVRAVADAVRLAD